MDVVKGYFDYCISELCVTSDFENILKRILELGYRTIAINQIIDESNLEPTKKKKKGESRDITDVVPAPIEFKKYDGCEDIKILNRLTIQFSQQDIINKIIKSPNYKKYHVVAVTPMSQAAFQFVCGSMEADILTFNSENKWNYKFNRKLYNQLVEKGFHFEILYSPAIQDSSQRKNIISTAHLLHMYGKSKNVIISSGITNKFLLRSPYDIVNLGFVFGLNEGQAKNAILNNGRNVYIHSVGRRHGKVMMLIENTIGHIKVEDDPSIINLDDEDEEMELNQPVQKKSKQ